MNKLKKIYLKNLLIDTLHDKQRKFVTSKNRRVATLCSRRAGKSHGIAVRCLLQTIDTPDELVIFVTQSIQTSVDILWPPIERISEQLNLGIEKPVCKNNQYYICPPWGGKIWLSGCPTKSDIKKYRGDRAALAIIDEAYNLEPYLRDLVDEAIGPRLADLDAQLYISGTPGDIRAGYFYEITALNKYNYDLHKWNVLDNPHINVNQEYLDNLKLNMNESAFKREWEGVWVQNNNSLIYNFDSNNIIEQPYNSNYKTIIGIDIGYNDPCSWVVLQYRYGDSSIYIKEAKKIQHLAPSEAAIETKSIIERYPGALVYADSGGIGKGYIEQWKLEHKIQCQAASKFNKLGNIHELSDYVSNGRIKIDGSFEYNKCVDLINEFNTLHWNKDRDGELASDQNHCIDALLYAFKEVNKSNLIDIVEVEADIKKRAELKAMQDFQDYLSGRKKKNKGLPNYF